VTVTAAILAGGSATRMGGRKKHELVVDGATIFARQRAVLAPRVGEIIVSLAPGAPDVPGFRCVHDAVGGRGPLAGIAAALAAIATDWLLVVAGDMPELHGGVIDAMLALAHAAAPATDAIGVRVAGRPQPLLTVLRRDCRTAVDRMLAAGRYKASQLLTDEGLQIVWLADDALRAIDPELRGLRNINTPADLQRSSS
jgi:molybdenum cofactor guanylyltransferase